MKTLQVIKVETPDQIKQYQSLYEREARLPLAAEYIEKVDAFLIFKAEILIAAYCLNNGEKVPFRYLSIFTDKAKAMVLSSPYPIEEDSFMEIAAIVMTDESSRKDHNLCYAKIATHANNYAFKHDKTRILGGSVIPKIQQMQFELMPHLLYKASIDSSLKIVNNADGMVMLYYATRNEFMLRAMFLLCKKQIKAVFLSKKPKTKEPLPRKTAA